MYVFKTNSQYSLKFLVTPFLQNGQVLYSFENKAYLKPCLNFHLHPYFMYAISEGADLPEPSLLADALKSNAQILDFSNYNLPNCVF